MGLPWLAVIGVEYLVFRRFFRTDLTGSTSPPIRHSAPAPRFAFVVLALTLVGFAVSGFVGVAPVWVAAASLAALLANVVNNLPATLVILGALGPTPHPGVVLAVLLGVNIGPNLTYVGSLATLLWRRVLAGHDAAPTLSEFLRLGALTVPACLAAATLTLWLALTFGRGWLL